MGNDDDLSVLRGQLVDRVSDAGYIATERVGAAFRAVPRHVFLPGVEPGKAYADAAVVTKWESDGKPISSHHSLRSWQSCSNSCPCNQACG